MTLLLVYVLLALIDSSILREKNQECIKMLNNELFSSEDRQEIEERKALFLNFYYAQEALRCRNITNLYQRFKNRELEREALIMQVNDELDEFEIILRNKIKESFSEHIARNISQYMDDYLNTCIESELLSDLSSRYSDPENYCETVKMLITCLKEGLTHYFDD